jgi:hypothetical protein
MGKHTRLKKLARHLLATTCLTAGAAAIADAQVVTEGTAPAPADFGNTFGAAYLLPLGTTQVNGSTHDNVDPADFITFQGLQGGTGFSFTATSTSPIGSDLNIFNSSDVKLSGPFFFSSSEGTSGNGTVPTDGLLTFDVFSSSEAVQSYSINLTATQAAGTPEPGTLGAMGLGLAAGAALMMRRKKKV